ncbi:hypothetical protein GDO81_022710 [Engystomops pustulosus]|uniref:Galactosyltransferase N-terminal domain-containing protein n=1 Tax=Engystomops pustulosus TaxID=76066 RepID=A0AAV6ZJ57_ENGPU|nr:hypothetical protein GDO81_022710 [Engystomops pustulosus]
MGWHLKRISCAVRRILKAVSAVLYLTVCTTTLNNRNGHREQILTDTFTTNVFLRSTVGPLTITFPKPPSLKKIRVKNPYVTLGGFYSPRHCYGRYRTAVIIPHRNREAHLRTLLYYLHPFLQRQQLHYAIFVVHQTGNATFNRAKLLNIGVREALRYNDWDCLILHDVDLIPENDYNLYICDDYYPKHLSSAMDKFQYR